MEPSVEHNRLSGLVIDAAFQVHSSLGPGLLESVYEACLIHELRKRGLSVESQLAIPIVYDDVTLDAGLRLDLWVNRQVIVELKAVESILPVHKAQILTYLKLTRCQLGLIINFNTPLIKNGIQRVVLTSPA